MGKPAGMADGRVRWDVQKRSEAGKDVRRSIS